MRGGWLHTGDVGSLDEEGFLTLKDRSKDMIVSGGSNIYPREVEEVLLRHPSVSEVSVVGQSDPGSSPDASVFDAFECALLRYTDAVVREVKAPEELFRAVASKLTHQQLVELMMTIGFYMLVSRLLENLEVDIEDPPVH